MIKEFKEFAVKGNAIDLAVGVIVGAAFGKIVDSLLKDIIMPPFVLVAGRVDFSNLFIALGDRKFATLAEAQAVGAPTLNYGLFINAIINFGIVTFAIFIMVRQINRFRRKKETVPNIKRCQFCMSDIDIDATRCAHCTSQLPG
jgi:large conductance mechanosensitive channel